MRRSFDRRPVEPELLEDLVDLATRAPSAGKTQGWHLVALQDAATDRFWRHTLAPERRSTFRWQRLLDAPVILLPFADPAAYVARYSEADKARSGLGAGVEAWPAPYWTIDASMAVMTVLLAAEDAGLGALFFGVFQGEAALREELGIPEQLELLGAIALGWPSADNTDNTDNTGGTGGTGGTDGTDGSGRSAARRRRAASEVLHHGHW